MIDQEICTDCGEKHLNCDCEKPKFVALDIDMISEELYQLLLKEFKRIHGKGHYECWSITANKTN